MGSSEAKAAGARELGEGKKEPYWERRRLNKLQASAYRGKRGCEVALMVDRERGGTQDRIPRWAKDGGET